MDVRSAVRCLVLVLTAGASAQEAVQWRVQDGGNGHWYRLLPAPNNWFQARTAAESMGGHLASLTSAGENQFALQVMGTVSAWLGGYQDLSSPSYSEPSGGWCWTTGEPWSFTAWSWWQPEDYQNQQHWLWMYGSEWHDIGVEVTGNARMLVEWSADCDGDGIVDYGQCRDGSLPDFDGNNIPDCCEEGLPCVIGRYPVCWRTQDGGNGHWYLARPDPEALSWATARQRALELRGDLPAIGDSAEWQFLTVAVCARLPLLNYVPLGLSQDPQGSEPAGGWRWTDGGSFSPVWGVGEPNNSNGNNEDWAQAFRYPDGVIRANDYTGLLGSGTTQWLVVEWSADCDGDGVVDHGQILRGEVNDVNANGVPDTCDCPADINHDGTIGAEDLAMVLFAWGMPGGKAGGADVDRSGTVDGSDLAAVLAAWGVCP